MSYTQLIKKTYKASLAPIRDDLELRKNKDFFWPVGTQVYIGRQGEGKTISAVKHALDIKDRYPQSIIVTNLSLTWLKAKTLTLTQSQLDELDALPPRAAGNKQSKLLVADLDEILRVFNPQTDYVQFSTMDELAVVLTQVNN